VDDLLSEQEQIDQMRSWWSEYGAYIIGGIVIGASILFGISYVQNTRLQAQLDASAVYETLVEHAAAGDLDDAEAIASDIATLYSETAYVGQAGLAMARLYMDQNRDQDAADTLNDLLAMAENDELKNVARLRLAHVLLYQDKPQDVVDLLTDLDVGAFNALYDEQLGDAYTSLGNFESAGDAYRRALADPSPNPVVDKGLVNMKLVDLPETVVAEASEEPVDEAVEEPAIEDGESE